MPSKPPRGVAAGHYIFLLCVYAKTSGLYHGWKPLSVFFFLSLRGIRQSSWRMPKQSHLLSVISGITSPFGSSQEQMGLLRPPSAGSQ